MRIKGENHVVSTEELPEMQWRPGVGWGGVALLAMWTVLLSNHPNHRISGPTRGTTKRQPDGGDRRDRAQPEEDRVRRSPRNLNSRIVARDRSDSRWWKRNRDVVKYLDQGLSVREISNLVSHGERQVRIIRERLHDLRTNNLEGEALGAVA